MTSKLYQGEVHFARKRGSLDYIRRRITIGTLQLGSTLISIAHQEIKMLSVVAVTLFAALANAVSEILLILMSNW